jgi:hypothetical protein
MISPSPTMRLRNRRRRTQERSKMPTPWSTEVNVVDGDRLVVAVMLSLDPGPLREFRPFLDVELDEAQATELLGKLSLALMTVRNLRGEAR